MKQILIACILLLSSSAFAFKTMEEATKKLNAFTVADIQGDADRLAQKKPLKIDEIFDDLQATADLVTKSSLVPTEALALAMERACLLASLHDPSNYAIDIIVAVYIKNKPVFESASESLHPTDRKNVMEPLRDKAAVALSGDN